MRPSVWKWPRASRGILSVRPPVDAGLSTRADAVGFAPLVAPAGAAVILLAVCAIQLPAPTSTAVRINRLRITCAHRSRAADLTISAGKCALTAVPGRAVSVI